MFHKDRDQQMGYAIAMNPAFQPHTLIAELLDQHPEFIPVFLRHHMICVGCGMASFDTLDDAIQNYGLQSEEFLAELRAVVKSLQKE
jgi:hybrid cluster-associated redox disulfide protein